MVIPEGLTVAEMLELVGMQAPAKPGVDSIVLVDDMVIQPSQYDTIRPAAGSSLAVRAFPSGGGGKNIMRTVLMIAVAAFAMMVVGPWAAGAMGLKAGTVGFNAAAFAIGTAASFAGNLALNALIPPAMPEPTGFDIGAFNIGNSAITGFQNRANPGGPVPRIFGKHRIYPLYAQQPALKAYGNSKVTLYMFVVGRGDYTVSDYKIGNTDIDLVLGNYTLQTYNVDSPPTTSLMQSNYSTDSFDVELLAGVDSVRATTSEGTAISLLLYWPLGIYAVYWYDDRGPEELSVTFDVSIRENGTADPYVKVYDYTMQDTRTSPFRDMIWLTEDVCGFSLAGKQWDVKIHNVYKITWANWTEVDEVHWVGTVVHREGPSVALEDTTVIELEIVETASDKGLGMLDTLNCLVEAKNATYTAVGGWAAASITRNPAWAFCAVLRNSGNRNPVLDARIDLDSIETWADNCTTDSRTFDTIVDFDSTVLEICRRIAVAGRASLTMRDGMIGVIEDRAVSTPIQHFSPRNSSGFKGIKVFQDVPHALRCQFKNEDEDYQPDEVMVYADGYDVGTATLIEAMDFWGITDSDLVWKDGRYFIAVGQLRPEKFQLSVDVEHLVCTRGDLVRLTHDVIMIGYGQARVKSFDTGTKAFEMDDSITMEIGTTYGVYVRLQDGSEVYSAITAADGEFWTVTTPDFGAGSGINVGDLCFFGESGSEKLDCKVTLIEPEKDFGARLTLVAAAPGVHTADSGPIPAFTSGITKAVDAFMLPAVPPITDVSLDETRTNILKNGTLDLWYAIEIGGCRGLGGGASGYIRD